MLNNFILGETIDFFLLCPISHSPFPILCLADSQAGVTALSRLYPHHPTTPASCLTSCEYFSLPQVCVGTTQVNVQ